MARETVGRTLGVALTLCLICSVLVSAAAVGLRPTQERNRTQEIRRNILVAAGYGDQLAAGAKVDALFDRIEVRLVDLASGNYIEGDPAAYDFRAAAREPGASVTIPADDDVAGIKRRPKVMPVYLAKDGEALQRIVLPVYGKGLWSTLYGFVAVRPDTVTVESLSFYEHGETPGLGGEIDNPRWKALWQGKHWLTPDFDPAIDVIKGSVNPSDPKAQYKVDGLSGATLTSNGVQHLMHYWAGAGGYGPYLAKMRGES